MAMDENAMADAILAELGGETTSEQGVVRKAGFVKFCKGIIEHIQAAAQISGPCTGLIAPPGTAGGPVTGTAILPPGSIQ